MKNFFIGIVGFVLCTFLSILATKYTIKIITVYSVSCEMVPTLDQGKIDDYQKFRAQQIIFSCNQ